MSNIQKIKINGQEYILEDAGAVRFADTQTLTAEQQALARENIGAVSAADIVSVTVDDALDAESVNPVQNKVIYGGFMELANAYTALNTGMETLAARVTPAVTADDNGKFLRVVDGAWSAVAVSNAEEASF